MWTQGSSGMVWSYRMSPPRASSTANTSGGLDSKGWGNRLGVDGRLYCRDSPRLGSGRVALFVRDLGAPERRHAQTLMSAARGAVGLLSGRRRGTIKLLMVLAATAMARGYGVPSR